MKARLVYPSIMLALVLLAGSMFAQVNTASLTGLVSDPSGAAIADAKVTATNTATNLQQSATTTSAGYYTFATLPTGDYKVTIEKQGFRVTTSAINLAVGSRARLDLTLQVGATSETVDVTGAAPLLTTQDAMPGAVVDDNTIHGAPLSARNWDDLLGLVPGVQADRYTEQGGGTAAGRTGGVNVHGVRSLQNNFVLDGVDNNSFSENVQELTTQIARPSLDAISEFKVSTNPYSAENGRSPGSLVSVTTKSGTNAFHGAAYEYLRNKVFDARDYFTARTASTTTNPLLKPKPAYNQNQFGGAIGGPIVKNKAFFFFNYEGTRIRKGRVYLANVPCDGTHGCLSDERSGNFPLAAGYTQINDRVGDCRAKAPGSFDGSGNLIGNVIPAACIDPAAAKILALVPHPNVNGSGPMGNVNNFANIRNLVDDANSYTGRFDWNTNATNNVFVRYTNTHRFRFVPGTFGGILDGTSTSAAGRLQMNAISASIGWNHIFTPRVVNEIRIGWGRDFSHGVQDPFGLNKESDYIAGVADSSLYNGGIPRIALSTRGGTQSNTVSNLSGVDNWGSPDFLPKFQYTNQFQWADTINWTLGRHQLRFGIDARMPMRNIYLDVPALRGRFSFDGQRTGIGLADFLLGYPQAAELASPAVTDARLWMLSGFFQDDFKLTPKLTLNYGIRYDYSTWPYSGADRITNIVNPDPTAVNAAATLVCAGSATAPCTASGGPSRGLVKPDKNNFAPRIGMAYQITPETVVRAGYGRFYMLFERAGSEDQMFLNPPWLVDKSVSASTTSTTVNNMRMATGFNLSLDPTSVNLTQVRLRAVNPNNVMPEVDQWNFGIERQLPGQMVATIEYVGTKGTHLSILENLNQTYFDSTGRACVAVGAASPNCPTLGAPNATAGIPKYVAYSNLGPIEYRTNVGNSTYHGLEASLQKRFSHNLSFSLAYTWSHSIDQAMEHLYSGGSNSFLQNEHDLTQQRGNSDFDTRHRLVMSYVYDLPFGKGQRWAQDGPMAAIAGGWRVSSIVTAHTGRPFTIFAGGNSSAFQTGGFGATALADCPTGAVSTGLNDTGGTGPYWFDPTQFSVPSAPNPTGSGANVPRLGTCSRNNMYGPGIGNVDFAINRAFKLFGEGRSLDFRWEAFNLFNTPYFSVPNHDCSSNCATNSSFGRITSLQGDPRTMQFSLRFSF